MITVHTIIKTVVGYCWWPIEVKYLFVALPSIATKEIRMIAAYEMLNVRAYQTKNRYDIEFREMGLGSSTELKGVWGHKKKVNK